MNERNRCWSAAVCQRNSAIAIHVKFPVANASALPLRVHWLQILR